MDDIRIDIGVYTTLEVDLSEFDFTGISEVVFTVKNKYESKAVIERSFTEADIFTVTVTPEESWALRSAAEYDFDIITVEGKRYKNGDNGQIVLRQGVGTCQRR